VATYYAAYAAPAGYKQFAPTLLTWTAMQVAKGRSCDIFDFGGIYDPRYPKMYKNWQGFTKFKSGFHHTTLSYPPTTLQLFW
jgi:lipid II:glycine glycyltransferase (peptidoglycan interpeptide bridge formation enzyme)